MRPLAAVLSLALFAACAPAEAPPAEEMPPAGLTLADVAGNWTAKAMTAAGDSTLTTYTMSGNADPASWMVMMPGRDHLSAAVTVDGDSLMMTFGPYESVLRAGQQVTVTSVTRMMDGKLVGTFTARYAGATGADSMLVGRSEAERTP